MVVVSLVAMVMGPVGAAIAAAPNVTIESPRNGSVRDSQTPSFSGLAEAVDGDGSEFKVTVGAGEGAGFTVNVTGALIPVSNARLVCVACAV